MSIYANDKSRDSIIIGPECMPYTHYISIDKSNRVIKGWSTGPHFELDTVDAIKIGIGSYQFMLFNNGIENPPLFTEDMIPLYKWDGEKVLPRTDEEIEADRAEIIANQPTPEPTEMEKMRADLDYVMLMSGLDVDPN